MMVFFRALIQDVVTSGGKVFLGDYSECDELKRTRKNLDTARESFRIRKFQAFHCSVSELPVV